MFRIEEFITATEQEAMEATVRRACEAGVRDPRAQFVIVDRYTRWDGYVGALVATLAGIREPSEGMKHSGTEFLYGEDFVENPAAVTTAVGTWHFMIDALRAELLPPPVEKIGVV